MQTPWSDARNRFSEAAGISIVMGILVYIAVFLFGGIAHNYYEIPVYSPFSSLPGMGSEFSTNFFGALYITIIIQVIYIFTVTFSAFNKSKQRQKRLEQEELAERQAEDERAKLQRQREIEQDEERKINEINGTRRYLVDVADRAVRSYSTLPTIKKDISRYISEAETHFNAGAYSPFWSAVEGAYLSLNKYLQALNEIREMANTHSLLVTKLFDLGADISTDCSFPVHVGPGEGSKVSLEIEKELDPLIYRAQQDSTFAIIWEQRRANSVLIQGFSNLEEVINQLKSHVSSEINNIAHSMGELSSKNQAIFMQARQSEFSPFSHESLRQQEFDKKMDSLVSTAKEIEFQLKY